jgi:multidrug resistance efflux pump
MQISSAHMCWVAVLAFALCGELVSVETWTVPEVREPVVFTFPSMVDIDRSSTTLILPQARDLIAETVVLNGASVHVGDPIITFDSRIHQNQIEQRERDLAVAQSEARLRELQQDDERRSLEDQRKSLEGDLAVALADLASAMTVDPDQIALATAERDRAEVDLRQQERLAAAARRAFAAGEITGDDLARREQSVSTAERALSLMQVELETTSNPDRRLVLERRRARVAEIRVKLGIDENGKAISGVGITGRSEALEARQRRERRQAQENLDQVRRRLDEKKKDSWDHSPLRSITLGDRHLRCAPEGIPEPEKPWLRCDDANYQIERGFGFTDKQGLVEPVLRTGRQGADGCLLIRGQAEFRIDCAPGEYHLSIELGDEQEWDGAVVSIVDADGPRVLDAIWRIQGRSKVEVTATVRITGDHLLIRFGDIYGKALRAPADGIALPREWIAPGWKPGWTKDPAAFLAGPGSLRLRTVLHQDLARLLRKPDQPNAEGSVDANPSDETDDSDDAGGLADQLHVTAVEWLAPDGQSGVAQVANVVRLAVPMSLRSDALGDGPLDRFGNEAFFAFPEAMDPAKLRLGTRVTTTATVVLPDDCSAIPLHLIGRSGERSYIQIAGHEPEACRSVRVGGFGIIDRRLDPGARLISVDLDAADANETNFPGTIVAGKSSPVACRAGGGRIASLIEDGSQVAIGDVVVTLYSPWIEDRREENIRKREQAQQVYEESRETRRVAAERAVVEHQGQLIAEQLARIDLQLEREVDAVALVKAEADLQRIESDHQLTSDILVRARDLGDPIRLETAERNDARGELQQQRAALDLVLAKRQGSWLAELEAEMAWKDTVTDLAGREQGLHEARIQEKAAGLDAELRLAQAMQGNWWEQQFEQGKHLTAPVAGRLFYRKGWDDRANRSATFQRDFWVWRGVTVADVLDTSEFAFEADLPESRVRELKAGTPAVVVLTRLDNRRLDARIESVGRAVLHSQDDDPTGVERRIGLRRVVRVRCSFAVPPELRDRLTPGTKAELELP